MFSYESTPFLLGDVGELHLRRRDDHDDDKQHDGDGASHAELTARDKRFLINHVVECHRLIARAAPGHGVNQGKQACKRPNNRHNNAIGDDAGDHREHNFERPLKEVCAVEFRRLKHARINAGHTAEDDDGLPADGIPGNAADHDRQGGFPVAKPFPRGGTEANRLQDLVDRAVEAKERAEEIAQDHERDDLRNVVNGAKCAPAGHLLIEQHGDDQADNDLQRDAQQQHEIVGKQLSKQSGAEKFLIVCQSDEVVFVKPVPIGEAAIDRCQNRIRLDKKQDQKNRQYGVISNANAAFLQAARAGVPGSGRVSGHSVVSFDALQGRLPAPGAG
ncbi:hypothetical protein SDC9_86929 [bioreactor metagenome]|uniref:Uncharacterized protein n=1 Tax=bioreactor metagenome TaxID=1076179 RepID=A0A644ZHJ2_9ZZZZ